MNSERDFAESPFSYKFNELVKLKSGRWQFICLLYVVLDIGDEFFCLFDSLDNNFITLRDTCVVLLLIY